MLIKITGLFKKNAWIYVLVCIFMVCMIMVNPIAALDNIIESEELYFTILHTNDEHSAVIPHSPAINHPTGQGGSIGGFARLATAIEEARSQKEDEGEPVLLFGSGDFMGGGAFSWMTPQGAAPELAIMQKIGYDAVNIGNHEYDYGPDVLAAYLLASGYPSAHNDTLILASNTEAPEDHSLTKDGLYRQTGMIELKNGLKVGIFGLIGNQAILVAANTGDLEFADQHRVAGEVIEELQNQGADIIVALTHSGINDDRKLARSVAGIDVIISGHCHTALETPIKEGDTLIVQTGSHLAYLGYLELAYNPDTEEIRVRNEESDRPFLIPIDDSISFNEEVAALIDDYIVELNEFIGYLTEGEYEDIYDTLARADFELEFAREARETQAGNFITDAMKLVTEEVTGEKVDLALQTNGSIRKAIIPGNKDTGGVISFYEIIEAVGIGYGHDGYPGYSIVSLYLTGKEIYRLLEASAFLAEGISYTSFLQTSGLRYTYNPDNAVMFTIPYFNIPIPSLRSITEAEIYSGEGTQPATGNEAFEPLRRDGTLYHVVTGTSLFSYMKTAANLLPQAIEPKNALGEPLDLDNPLEYLVHRGDGRELKLWEAVVKHAAAQPPDEDGIAQITDYYRYTSERINRGSSFPRVTWVIIFFILLIAGIVFLVRRRRRKRAGITSAG